MSNNWNSNSSSSRNRRLIQIDDDIECLAQEVNTLNDVVDKIEFECCLMIVKKKRENLRVLSAIAKSKKLLAKTKISIAEGDLLTDIERLMNSKRTKLVRNEDKFQVNTPSRPHVSPPPTTATVSVQTIESMSNQENETRQPLKDVPG